MVKRAFDDLATFIAEIDPQKVLTYRPTQEAQKRVEELIRREKIEVITPMETEELEHYLLAEHVIRMAKIRAYQCIN